MILKGPLCDQTKDAILQLQSDLAERFPPSGEELDASEKSAAEEFCSLGSVGAAIELAPQEVQNDAA